MNHSCHTSVNRACLTSVPGLAGGRLPWDNANDGSYEALLETQLGPLLERRRYEGLGNLGKIAYAVKSKGHDREAAAILAEKYWPRLARRENKDKPGGGTRPLSIKPVADRDVDRAVADALEPVWEPLFHPLSYGFRPKCSQSEAILGARELVRKGLVWILSEDILTAFPTIHRPGLMHLLGQRIKDPKILKLIRRIIAGGIIMPDRTQDFPEVGIPQGSPLAPLLFNIVLNELDWFLHRSGFRCIRWADNLWVFCRNKAATILAKDLTVKFLGDVLHLELNPKKTATEPPEESPILGFLLWRELSGEIKIGLAPDRAEVFGERLEVRMLEDISLADRAQKINRLTDGWSAYFRIAEIDPHGIVPQINQLLSQAWANLGLNAKDLHVFRPNKSFPTIPTLAGHGRLRARIVAIDHPLKEVTPRT